VFTMEPKTGNVLDDAIIAHLSHAGEMGVGPLARAIGRPYTTVMVHVLALAAANVLTVTWRGRDRYVGLAGRRNAMCYSVTDTKNKEAALSGGSTDGGGAGIPARRYKNNDNFNSE